MGLTQNTGDLVASCDQKVSSGWGSTMSIFFIIIVPNPDTSIEETMKHWIIVRSGRALYVGISNYRPAQAREAFAILHQLGTPCYPSAVIQHV
jgi:L-glyceraldehyde 3-phosphate reductase